MRSFRHSAGFGKRIEYWIIGRMLKEGLDVYVPLVDDHAVDAIVKRSDGTIRPDSDQGTLCKLRRNRRRTICGDTASRRTSRLLVCLLFRANGQNLDT